jgi:FKBP-type peptidyl-prolyl cis-trans isomerase
MLRIALGIPLACLVATASLATAREEAPDLAGATTTATGLRYRIDRAGADGGAVPRLTDVVRIHYTAWLASGSRIDSTHDRERPLDFMVGAALVEGWNEALPLLREGGRMQVHVPSALAYGEEGSPPSIPANTDLLFDIELLRVFPGPGLPSCPTLDGKTESFESGLAWTLLLQDEAIAPVIPALVGPFYRYAAFTTSGRLLESSELTLTTVGPESPNHPFLDEIASVTTRGDTIAARVPAGAAFVLALPEGLAPGEETVWRLEHLAPPHAPVLDPSLLERSPTGLEVTIERPGKGEPLRIGDRVEIQYTGWLEDGTVFETTWGIRPAELQVGNLIAGLNEGLVLLREGARATFRIPWDLAYGRRGNATIPARATLVFTVEVLRILP